MPNPPPVPLPTLRAFLGAIALQETATTSPNLALAKLQGGAGQQPLTKSDTDVRDVVNAIVDALDNLAGVTGGGASSVMRARAVKASNASSLTAFAVSVDDVTLEKNNVVLLTKQTTASENGPWVIGDVSDGAAALTRPSWWSHGSAFASGCVIEVGGEGSAWKNSTWKAFAAGGVVDSDDPGFIPRIFLATATLSSGSASFTGLWFGGLPNSLIWAVRGTPSGTLGHLGVSASVAGAGTGTATVNTSNVADTSLVAVYIVNF